MTVKELIAELAKYPDSAEVTVVDRYGEDVPPAVVYDEFANEIHLF